MPTDPIAPLWLVLPLAGIALIVQAGYLIALKELPKGRIPPSRKRIRTATGWMSMFAIPLSAYGFGFSSTNDPRTFAIVWMLVIGLIFMILILAGLDAINTMRLHRQSSHDLQSQWASSLKISGSDRESKSFEDESDEQ